MISIEGLNVISHKIIGAAFNVHNELGPGFIEKIYSQALAIEFEEKGIKFEREKAIRINYKGREIGEQRIDFLVEDNVILEIKAIESIGKLYLAQVISYLKALDRRLGLVVNFGNTKLEVKRVANNL